MYLYSLSTLTAFSTIVRSLNPDQPQRQTSRTVNGLGNTSNFSLNNKADASGRIVVLKVLFEEWLVYRN